jgi:hypothetical protein
MSIKSVVSEESPGAEWERVVRRALSTLRYGSVELQVHDGRVVQVETREKLRFGDERWPDHRRRQPAAGDRAYPTHGGAAPTEEETIR